MVGAIIGKGGAKINEIRQLSGSVIKINEPTDNSNERLVTITGTQECNQMALYMLYSRLGKLMCCGCSKDPANWLQNLRNTVFKCAKSPRPAKHCMAFELVVGNWGGFFCGHIQFSSEQGVG